MAVKKLGDLTVEEATKELKKRGLDVNGDRNMLIARLRKALTEQRKPPVTPASTGSNQTEKTQLSPTVDKAAPAAGAEDVSQVPTSMSQVPASMSQVPASMSQVSASSSTEEKKPPTPEADHSPVKPQQGAKEGGVEHPAEVKEEEEKVADDPPLDLLADESQNDLDDDIVCVSMTPGKGFRVNEGSGQKQVQKDSPQKTTTPSKDSKIGSAFAGASEQDGSKSDLSLWVSGLDSTSRAADLKTLFSGQGKVTGAKVVASAKAPDSKCFGIVTMATADDVEKCIMALDGASLQGKTITVELYSGHRKTVEKALVTPPTPTLWVTGITPDTKAPELKKLFVPHGRVVAATIVMNASGGTSKRCGLVKMSSCDEADLCIQKVNNTTLNGRVITVERAKSNRLPTAKTQGKAANRSPPALMSQKLPRGKPASGSKPRSLLDPLLAVKGNNSKPGRPRERGRGGRRGIQGGRMGGRRGSNLPPPPFRMRMEREREMIRLQHEQQVKAKEAELVRVLALEFDRQKQKEEAERLAYEREQLEVERMRLERQRMEAERLRAQLEQEQERRHNEREQLERERARNQMLRNEQRMSLKRAAEQEDSSYYDYLMKKGRANSPPQSSSQNFGRGPNMYENTNQRLQQMAHGAERRLNESRMKNSIPSGSGSSMGGRQMQGSGMYRQSSGMDSSVESGSKSEWKSLFNMSSGGSGNNGGGEQNQWKSLSSSSLGRNLNDDYSFSSGSSFRGRPYPGNNSGFGGMKSQYGSGFKGGRGGGGGGAGGGAHKWR